MAARSIKQTCEVRNSPIHGRGVFATRGLKTGEMVIEYTGEIISDALATERYGTTHDQPDSQQNHTFLFSVSNGTVIDATKRNTTAKWMNHCCAPNCQTYESSDCRIFVEALRDIAAGEELVYDYHIMLEERHTAKAKALFKCLCGAPGCRGTLLADKRKFKRKAL